MKNKQIVDAWNKIKPDSAADAHMLSAILARNTSEKLKRIKGNVMFSIINWRRLAPVAACFVIVFVLVGVFGNNAEWFGNRTYTVNTSNGETLNFHKADMPGESDFGFDFDVSSRDLTGDETRMLFGNLPVKACATFNTENHSLMRLEGRTSDANIIVARRGQPISDTILTGPENVSEIGGVTVTAGFFMTQANSRGEKNIIFFASWGFGDVTEYVELGGDSTHSEILSHKLASIIEQLIQQGAPDLSQITEQLPKQRPGSR